MPRFDSVNLIWKSITSDLKEFFGKMLLMLIFPNEKYIALKQLLKTPTLINTTDFSESFLLNLDR